MKVKYQDIEVGLDFEPAQRAGTALVLFIDEFQYVEEELAALITALHRTAGEVQVVQAASVEEFGVRRRNLLAVD